MCLGSSLAYASTAYSRSLVNLLIPTASIFDAFLFIVASAVLAWPSLAPISSMGSAGSVRIREEPASAAMHYLNTAKRGSKC